MNAGRVKPGQTGSDHPAWRGDDVSEDAGRQRAQRQYPGGAPCERCGAPYTGGHSVERHHRDGNTKNNAPENIAWLCPPDHAEAHRMRDAMERRADRSALSDVLDHHGPFELDPLEPGAEPDHQGMAMVSKPCVCGGSITAANNPGMILAAVTAHNDTRLHSEWRAVNDLQRPTRRQCPCHDHGRGAA